VAPGWNNSRRAAPPAPVALKRVTPSTVTTSGNDIPLTVPPRLFSRSDPTTSLALDRGRLVHRLLQSLPDIAAADRVAIGASYLGAFADGWSDDERSALLAEVMATLDHPDFAPVFAAGSRAEVDIAGSIGAARVSGRIDRLAVTPARVLIVDYKTNRPAPTALAAVPDGYIAQLALYRSVLHRLYPDRPVAAALLWTDGPSLMEIPEEVLILAESRLSAA